MSLQFRSAGDADSSFLFELNRRAYEDVVTRQFGAWDAAVQDARFAAKVRAAGFRIVEHAGAAIGAVWSSVNDDHVFLHELILLPEWQGRGLGSQVLEMELERARALGKPLRLHTLRLGRAQAFFRAHGFAETGITDEYVEMVAAG